MDIFLYKHLSSLYNVEPVEKIFGTHVGERDATEAITPLLLIWCVGLSGTP